MRLIDADALIDDMCEGCSAIENGACDHDICASVLWIKNAPTIEAEPIVLCGKCRNHKDFIDDSEHCRCLLLKQTVNRNDYCSFGGR